MRINSRGRVTIPAEIRRKAGLLPGTEVDIICDGDSVYVVKVGQSHDATSEQAGGHIDERVTGAS